MTTKSLFLYLILFISSFCLVSCDEEITTPEPYIGFKSRNIRWTKSEIGPGDHFYMGIHYLWAINSRSIYLSVSGPSGRLSTWYYNGINWESITLPLTPPPLKFVGFDENDFWTMSHIYGGVKFLHKSSEGWGKEQILNDEEYYYTVTSFYVKNANEIIGVGGKWKKENDHIRFAYMVYFNGEYWRSISLPKIPDDLVEVYFDDSVGKYIIFSHDVFNLHEDFFTIYEFCLQDSSVSALYNTKRSIPYLTQIGNEVYICDDGIVYDITTSGVEQLYDFRDDGLNFSIFGNRIDDVFLTTENGISHFNGTDVKEVLKFDNPLASPYKILVFEKEVIAFAQGLYVDLNTINCYHGILKE